LSWMVNGTKEDGTKEGLGHRKIHGA
jgi:hypothetical protein